MRFEAKRAVDNYRLLPRDWGTALDKQGAFQASSGMERGAQSRRNAVLAARASSKIFIAKRSGDESFNGNGAKNLQPAGSIVPAGDLELQ